MEIKYLNKKNINVFSLLAIGILYFFIGLFFLLQKHTLIFAIKGLLNLLTILLLISGFLQLLGFSLVKQKRIESLARGFGFLSNTLMAALIYFKPQMIISILPISFGIYAFSSGIIRLLIYIQYRRNKVDGRILILIGSFVLSFFGLMMVTKPLSYLPSISNLIGVFFILYGLAFIVDSIDEGLPREKKDYYKRRVRINLPVFMVAMIPHKVLRQINKAFEVDKLSEDDLVSFKNDSPSDLEILIHVGEKGTTAFGHVDIYFNGKILTYGSYDESTYKLKGLISDGVLMEIEDKDKYIEFSQDYFNKTLFGFGLKLTEDQKYRVKEKINDIYENLYVWKPVGQIAEESNMGKKTYKDYASIVYDRLRAKFYKFKEGPFKTYFGLNTNCVLLADTIVGQAGIDIIKINGLITPGAYFEYFNREFARKNSFVVSRTIYYK